ncbi:MAG: bifunctional diaminohydroxyphosphoribosylaminopyrimidine deaminase/5-amino-6-(5-phosphoribosylamino)uracil reductase RibD [Chitinophagaceae bacterium]|nr:bifunctional diaminohydroxyphosphoribosylaminopyrimidine deaminase/5-amino-6-(5-phosphoribosylamino)uracil reductase RibD [Chitinophagaceae bacterium]
MQRCLQLAALGAGRVAPNPLVGAVLVFEDRIIGEGYHQQYGGPHAEVNCLQSVKPEDRHLVPHSTLFVSLEPCAHFGKTPPCADLIVREQIKQVWIGCRDPFPLVDGKGIEKLETAGVQVHSGLLEAACREENRRFFTFHEKKRPYIILKWACTSDGFMAAAPGQPRLLISNQYSNRLVHQWRSEEAAILIGSGTALADDPQLTNRLWPGPSPVRVILDRHLRLPQGLQVFDGSQRTLVFNKQKEDVSGNVAYYQVKSENFMEAVWQRLHLLHIQSVLVEGGQTLLQTLLDAGYWDEIRIIRSKQVWAKEGLQAPQLKNVQLTAVTQADSDSIEIYRPV